MHRSEQPLILPYRWRPVGAQTLRDRRPQPGDLLPLAHAVYRVVECRPLPEQHWSHADQRAVATGATAPYVLRLRPVAASNAEADLFAGSGGAHDYLFDRYPSAHYPICADCREPVPCRDQMAERVAKAAAQRMERYGRPGICPACAGRVRAWQKSRTWQDNAVVPGGPPVTFHLRRMCRRAADEYARQLNSGTAPTRAWTTDAEYQ